jgi:hypothetical protein
MTNLLLERTHFYNQPKVTNTDFRSYTGGNHAPEHLVSTYLAYMLRSISMKKAAIASLLSIAALSLCGTTVLAQDPGQVTIKDQAEYNAFTNAESQTTPAPW